MIKLNISFIKYKNDTRKFNFFKAFGANIIELDNPEDIDIELEKLYKNDCRNIILSNEVANFSEDIIKKYKTNENISIFIAPKK